MRTGYELFAQHFILCFSWQDFAFALMMLSRAQFSAASCYSQSSILLNLELILSKFAKPGRPDWSSITNNTSLNGFRSNTKHFFTAIPNKSRKFYIKLFLVFSWFMMLLMWCVKDKRLSKATPRNLGLLLAGNTFSLMTTLILYLTSLIQAVKIISVDLWDDISRFRLSIQL